MPGNRKHEQEKPLKRPTSAASRSKSAELASGTFSAQLASSADPLEQELSDMYREAAGPLFRYALLLTRDPSQAQDAVQETFLKYYVQRRRGESPEGRAWFFRVLRNHVIDQQKSAGTKRAVALEAAHDREDRTQSPYLALECSETMRLVLEVLSPREFQCLQLRAEGFSYKEIADILAIESGTVGALLTRGSEKIRKAFAEEGLPCDAR
jgi:RNA polymerase sigma-70 factor (ECF subfamily)